MEYKFMSFGSGGMVKKVVAVGACAFVLQACAVPVPLKIASWALDGISYLATKKSLTDHGLSMVAQQDCAMLRGLQGEEICRDGAPGNDGVTVAALTSGAEPAKAEAAVAASSTDASQAGDQPAPTEAWTPPAAAETAPEADTARAASFETAAGSPDTAQVSEKPVVRPVVVQEVKTEPWGELYYVVASFRELDRADVVLQRYPHLELRVLSGVLDGAEVYRVAAGPFHSGDGFGVKKMIRDAGLKNAWAVRMPSSRWTVARAPSSDRQLAAVPDIDTVTID